MNRKWFNLFILAAATALLLTAASHVVVKELINLLNRQIAINFARGVAR